MRWPTVPSPEGKGDLINQEAVNELVDYAIAHGAVSYTHLDVYKRQEKEEHHGFL